MYIVTKELTMKNNTYKGFVVGYCEEGSVSYGRGMRVFVDINEHESEFYTNMDNAKAAIDFWESGDEDAYIRHLEQTC